MAQSLTSEIENLRESAGDLNTIISESKEREHNLEKQVSALSTDLEVYNHLLSTF